jgi:hypothetical protein
MAPPSKTMTYGRRLAEPLLESPAEELPPLAGYDESMPDSSSMSHRLSLFRFGHDLLRQIGRNGLVVRERCGE